MPRLSLASMPDLIFTILFFFMMVTHMRTETPRLSVTEPEGKELTRTSRQRTVTNIYVGKDTRGATLIQIGERIVPLNQVRKVITDIRSEMAEGEVSLHTVNIKADKDTPMGMITDLKQELRKAGALTIRYSARENTIVNK